MANPVVVWGMLLCMAIPPKKEILPAKDSLEIIHYHFRISLNDTSDCIVGLATLDIRFPRMIIPQLQLDLDGLHAATGKGMVVKSIRFAGQLLPFSQDSGKLTMELGRIMIKSDTESLEIAYQGIPADGLIISKNKSGHRMFFGDNWPDRAHDWLPVIDRPAAKATVDFVVIAPDRDQVVSNGRLVERSNLGGGYLRTHWRETVPITPYLMVIGVAPFAVQFLPAVHGTPLESWVYPQDRKKGFADFAVAGKVLALYEKYLGPFPFEKLANVESTTRYGGMENASCIFYDDKQVTGRHLNEVIIAHEIAHQWFGDDVTEKDWHHIWLSEGFATFFENFYIGKVFGTDSLETVLRQNKKKVFALYRRRPAPVVDTTITNLNLLLNANTYQKGGYVLRMLEHLLGKKKFWEGMRKYYQRYRHGCALTSDFERSMEQVAHTSLSWFFREWIYRPGYPVLDWNWTYRSETRSISVHLVQRQHRQVYRMPVDLRFYLKGERVIRKRLNLDQANQTWNFRMPERPDSVVIDPQQYLLMKATLTHPQAVML